MDRRKFLEVGGAGLLAAGLLESPLAQAIGPDQRIRVARIRHSGHWDRYKTAPAAFIYEVRQRTSIDAAPVPLALRVTAGAFGRHPLALLTGDDAFRFSDVERKQLKRWLSLGGFLVIDNSGFKEPSKAFDTSVRKELAAMFPNRKLERVSPEHVVYRSFYRLDYPAGRAIRKPYIEGLTLGRRLAVVVSHNDLFGAFERAQGGGYAHIPTPGGENQREMAFRFGVNLLMYALCLHYKDDQVHLDFLLHKRKWKIRRPPGGR